MKRKLFVIAGTLVVLLALGLVLAGCDNGSTNGDGGEAHTVSTRKIIKQCDRGG
jgi:hypothetical protein